MVKMETKKLATYAFAAIILIIAIAGLVYYLNKNNGNVIQFPGNNQTPIFNMSNPAATFCVQNGGRIDIRKETSGEAGYCVFSDGSECDEWSFMRGECAKAEITCRNQCGDGTCQDSCEGSGCPCPESYTICPQDCRESAVGKPTVESCQAEGGTLEVRVDSTGEHTYCILPGQIPNPAALKCREDGGRNEIRSDPTGATYGMCVFSDGSECEEWDLYRGDCKRGTYTPPAQ